jgi:hypothetical protein
VKTQDPNFRVVNRILFVWFSRHKTDFGGSVKSLQPYLFGSFPLTKMKKWFSHSLGQ